MVGVTRVRTEERRRIFTSKLLSSSSLDLNSEQN